MRVMIVVTHLLGTGHLSRALTLAHVFQSKGHAVKLVTGGFPAPHLSAHRLDIMQLPPLRSDGTDFTTLLTENGEPASDTDLAQRMKKLLTAFKDFAPDTLITELFPFGRRNLKNEFLSLLEAAAARGTCVLSSIRDILNPPSKPAKAAFADDVINRYYSGVLVHGDPDIAPLSQSWPVGPELEKRLLYTGYIAPPAVPMPKVREGIVVSAGGGNVGDRVFDAALEAAQILRNHRWHLFVGGTANRREELAQRAPDHVEIRPLSPDFRACLSSAAASISLSGYNTAIDILQSGTPCVLVPFDEGGEVEQSIRAKSLSRLAALSVVRAVDLSAASLTSAVTSVLDEGPRPPLTSNMRGALRSVQVCEALMSTHAS